ncbi:hypothetical protein TWF696_008548 [Orbilia brochopaga]|uniref:Uncharacterized protein n=1 Tax=Orbilia brochopaga TaxID=3140254 RepID=A0AAV9UKR2_9PEZI
MHQPKLRKSRMPLKRSKGRWAIRAIMIVRVKIAKAKAKARSPVRFTVPGRRIFTAAKKHIQRETWKSAPLADQSSVSIANEKAREPIDPKVLAQHRFKACLRRVYNWDPYANGPGNKIKSDSDKSRGWAKFWRGYLKLEDEKHPQPNHAGPPGIGSFGAVELYPPGHNGESSTGRLQSEGTVLENVGQHPVEEKLKGWDRVRKNWKEHK